MKWVCKKETICLSVNDTLKSIFSYNENEKSNDNTCLGWKVVSADGAVGVGV